MLLAGGYAPFAGVMFLRRGYASLVGLWSSGGVMPLGEGYASREACVREPLKRYLRNAHPKKRTFPGKRLRFAERAFEEKKAFSGIRLFPWNVSPPSQLAGGCQPADGAAGRKKEVAGGGVGAASRWGQVVGGAASWLGQLVGWGS